MIKMNYDDIITKIEENSDHTKAEIQVMIDTKLKQLSGLISKEGAAHIVANQLGIKLIAQASGKLEVKNILTGMRDVELLAKVLRTYPLRSFNVEGRKGQVASMVVGDETGTIRVVLWGDHAEQIEKISNGTIIKVKSGYVRERNNQKEVHLGNKSNIMINPKGETVESVELPETQERPPNTRKRLNELQEGDDNIDILGTVVQLFDPRFYEVCPKCGKKANQKEGVFMCSEHNEVTPNYAYVLNAVLDDGNETMRTVLFRNQALNLLKIEDSQMQDIRKNPEEFESIKSEMLGNIVKLTGRVQKNQMFGRLEFVARFVDANPDPEAELKHLNAEIEKVKTETAKSTENIDS